VESSSRLGLLRRSPSFAYLFLATAGSSFGTYLAVIALTVAVKDLTESGVWVAALLIADFLPIVLIGLLLGPLVDRLSRRRLMIASDLVRFGVFAALPFVHSAELIVALAAVSGVATGFFMPAANAGLPNLVEDEDLANANSLVQTMENLAWMIGPVVGGLMLTAWGSSVPYVVNAVTFLVSAALIARIPRGRLQSEESLTRGHWRDVADGLRLVVTARPLRTVLVVWNVVLIAAGAVNVAEVFFAKDVLQAGDLGFGALVAASGVGLVLGSLLVPNALAQAGLRRAYVSSIVLMGVGWGAAALSGSIWLAVPFVIGGAAGNGAAVVCNRLLVQRGAPDRFRGRALATIMSSNYAVLGLSMAAAGVLLSTFDAQTIWIAAGCIYIVGAFVALLMTRWLPVSQADEWEAVEVSSESAVAALGFGDTNGAEPEPEAEPRAAPEPEPVLVSNGAPPSGLERIAVLLEEIEARRELEAQRRSR
jgi:MFS family permease